MADRYLLDTNILSQLVRDPTGILPQLAAVGATALCTSIVVACELRVGARKKGSATLAERVDELLTTLTVLPLESGVDKVYAEIRHRLESRGTPIGAHDCLIAAHALHSDCVLVTDNEREFRRIPKLRSANWLRP